MRGNISKNKNGQGEMIQTLERFDNNKLDTLTDVGVYAVSMPFDNVSSLYYLFVSVQASEGTDDSGRAYVTNTYSQFLMSSDALKSRSKTIKTYKDDETQSVGEWSEWKTTEGAITKTVKNYEDIDSCCDGGVYFVEGRTDQISEGSTETLIVSSAGRVFCQHYFYYDGRVEYRQQQNGKWSNWKSVGITSYNDLTDKPNLSKVATSGSYEDLTGKPDLSDYATKESLDKILIPGSEKIVDRAENDDEGNNIRLTYATKEKLDNLIVFGNVVARAECDDLGNKIRLTYATKEELKSGGGGVTSYNDLTDKPITVLNYEPTNEQLAQMGEGIYLARVEDYTFPDYLYFFSTREKWEYYDNVECKHESWTTTIISHNGVRVERKDNYRAFQDGREAFTIDWREVPLNGNVATKEYVDSAIKKVDLTDKIAVEDGKNYETMTLVEEIRANTDGTYENIYIGNTGSVNTNANYALFDYMKFDPSTEKLFFYYSNGMLTSIPLIVCYDENKSFISSVRIADGTPYADEYIHDDITYTGHMYDIPENTSYIRINMTVGRLNSGSYLYVISEHTSNPTVYIPNLVVDKPFKGMNILNLGDSIFGNDRKRNISQYLAEFSGATVYNGGFGGTRMTIRTGGDTGSGYEYFDGVNLVTALTTGNWTNQDTGVGIVPTTYYAETLEMLKNLDMSTVDIVTIAWGTNDYTAKKTVEEITTALESIIDMIQSAYPTIRILVCTPIWRYFDDGDGDTKIYNASTLKDIALAIEETAKNKRVSVLNGYQNLPLSANTASTYFDVNDKTHLNEKGNALYAHLINGKLNSIF